MPRDLISNWRIIRETLDSTVSIAWDGCHKIYLLLDETEHDQMVRYGYAPLLRVADIGADAALHLIEQWWDQSCGLRFVQSVRTVDGDPNLGFTSLIEQFEDYDDADWEDED